MMAFNFCDVIVSYYSLQYIMQYLCACTIVDQSKVLENEMRYLNNDVALRNEFNNRYEPVKNMLATILSEDY